MDYSQNFVIPSGLTYFDSAATSLIAKRVIQKVDEYYRSYKSNIHRGNYSFSIRASEEYEKVYDILSKFFNSKDDEFISVRNTTEGINYLSYGIAFKSGDEIIVSDVEHHSNLLPWLRLRNKGIIVRILETDENGRYSPSDLSNLINNHTKLVSLTASSNVLACKEPIEEVVKVANDNGVLIHLDAAQFIGHHRLDLNKVKVDYLTFSSHKIFGPTGVGVLYHRDSVPLEPLMLGGGTISSASLNDYKLIENRERFEAGTPAIAQWIGLGESLNLISSIGYAQIEEYEEELTNSLNKVLIDLSSEGLTYYGEKDSKQRGCPLFSFNISNLHSAQVAITLDKLGFAVRSGHHCAIPVTEKLKVSSTVRASLSIYNNLKQIEEFSNALKQICLLS